MAISHIFHHGNGCRHCRAGRLVEIVPDAIDTGDQQGCDGDDDDHAALQAQVSQCNECQQRQGDAERQPDAFRFGAVDGDETEREDEGRDDIGEARDPAVARFVRQVMQEPEQGEDHDHAAGDGAVDLVVHDQRADGLAGKDLAQMLRGHQHDEDHGEIGRDDLLHQLFIEQEGDTHDGEEEGEGIKPVRGADIVLRRQPEGDEETSHDIEGPAHAEPADPVRSRPYGGLYIIIESDEGQ